MTRTDHRHPALRVSVPTLEPDDAFVERLSALAAVSGAADSANASRTRRGWRVGLAAAGMATVLAGGGVVAAAVTGPDEAPSRPRGPATPGEPSGVDLTPGGVEPSQRSTTPRDEDGSPGGSGSAPADSQDRAQDRAQDRGSNGVGAEGAGPGQAGQSHGQAGEDHGPQDGNGDEAHGQDGLPHGQAGQNGQQGQQDKPDEPPGLGMPPAGDHASSQGGPEGSGDD